MKRDNPVSTELSDYHHVQEYRVRYEDLNTYRHVNNKAFLSYVEDARVRYLIDAAGFSHHHDDTNGVMVVHSSIDYHAQIFPFETVRVHTRTARIGVKSFTLHHVITAGPGATELFRVAATSTTVLASVNLKEQRSQENSPAMVATIGAYEKGTPGPT
jgi:acyl-CoA thioester hydrolase